MSDETDPRSNFTIGSLLGVPLGRGQDPSSAVSSEALGRAGEPLPEDQIEGSGWQVHQGEARSGATPAGFASSGVEDLTYNNPFAQTIERVWFDGHVVYAADQGEVDIDPARVKVAQEYQIVYGVDLNEHGKPTSEPQAVTGQYNIYDSIPGMDEYSPIWQFNYVIVPRDYEPNRLRSESDCLTSGYRIVRSNVFEN
jgi:hypothetical protein